MSPSRIRIPSICYLHPPLSFIPGSKPSFCPWAMSNSHTYKKIFTCCTFCLKCSFFLYFYTFGYLSSLKYQLKYCFITEDFLDHCIQSMLISFITYQFMPLFCSIFSSRTASKLKKNNHLLYCLPALVTKTGEYGSCEFIFNGCLLTPEQCLDIAEA